VTVRRAVFAIAVAVQLAVLYAPEAGAPGGVSHVDKVVHAAIFGLVAWTGRLAGLPVVPLVVVLLGHAMLSEVVQAALLPARSGSLADSLADAAGVVLAIRLPVSRRGAVVKSPVRDIMGE
jgi:VanZ family protein